MTGPRQHPPAAPVELPDGSVIVPAHLAGAVRRILLVDLGEYIRRDGGAATAGVRQLVYALGRAEQHTPTDAATSASGSTSAMSCTVECSTSEAAEVLGCTARHVRALVRSGRIQGRRIGQRAWAIDRASLDNHRYGTN